MRFLTVFLLALLTAAIAFLAWQVSLQFSDRAPGELQPVGIMPESLTQSVGVEGVAAAPGPASAEADSAEPAPDWSELNSQALRALDRGEYEQAVRLLESCHEGDPAQDIFRRNLAEALARLALHQHELPDLGEQGSLEVLARAVELAPERPQLASLLARWQRSQEAEEGFSVHETLHFEIRFDSWRDELRDEFYVTGDLETLLEDTYHEFGERFAFYPVEAGRARIRVVVYRREAFESVTGLGSWAGGVFDGSVRVPIDTLAKNQRSRLERVLRHELMHAFVAEVSGNAVPGWLNEGLAQWFEPPGGAQAGAARRFLSGQELFTLEELTGSLVSLRDPRDLERAYAQSLAFVLHIRDQYGEELPFRLVSRLGEGATVADAFLELTHGVPLAADLADFAASLDS